MPHLPLLGVLYCLNDSHERILLSHFILLRACVNDVPKRRYPFISGECLKGDVFCCLIQIHICKFDRLSKSCEVNVYNGLHKNTGL